MSGSKVVMWADNLSTRMLFTRNWLWEWAVLMDVVSSQRGNIYMAVVTSAVRLICAHSALPPFTPAPYQL